MPATDKRHQEVIRKIKQIMKEVSTDLMVQKTMPVLKVPKVGSDNTIWSEEKRMLTIGDKTVAVSPDSTKKIPTFTQYLVMANAIRKLLDEEIVVNPTLAELCRTEFGFELPPLEAERIELEWDSGDPDGPPLRDRRPSQPRDRSGRMEP